MRPKALYRSLRVLEHLVTGAAIALYARLRSRFGAEPRWLRRIVRWWHARLCRALGVEVRIQGHVAPGCLLVGNHISWLDIPVLGAQGEIGFLSKADVRRWPLIGWMAETAGTRFIERGAHQAEDVMQGLRQDLAEGRSLMIFPEGTTTDGRGVKRFHPRLFAITQGAELGIQPVAIRYQGTDSSAPDTTVAYVGDDMLLPNLWRVIRHPGLVASAQFLPPIWASPGEQRRALAERARCAIAEALQDWPEASPRHRPAATEQIPVPLDPETA